MAKKILYTLLAVLFSTLKPYELEIWQTVALTGNLAEKTKLNLELENDFQADSTHNTFLVDTIVRGEVFQKITKNHAIALQYQNWFIKEAPRRWRREYIPSLNFYYSIPGTFSLDCRFRIFSKIVENTSYKSGFSAQIGTSFAKHKSLTAYLTNETFYNWTNTRQIDRNTIAIGLRAEFTKKICLDSSYIFFPYKSGPGAQWILAQVISITLHSYF